MNTLLIQDSFEPYYAGRAGYVVSEPPRRPEPAQKPEARSPDEKAPKPVRKPAEH